MIYITYYVWYTYSIKNSEEDRIYVNRCFKPQGRLIKPMQAKNGYRTTKARKGKTNK